MSDFSAKYVKCPFYIRTNGNRICCEGVGKENTINLVFESFRKLEEYKNEKCCDIDRYHHCMICSMLDRKYGV